MVGLMKKLSLEGGIFSFSKLPWSFVTVAFWVLTMKNTKLSQWDIRHGRHLHEAWRKEIEEAIGQVIGPHRKDSDTCLLKRLWVKTKLKNRRRRW